ncbi:response regulator [Saccharothrix deserti]|uniref:response regulator n=1 Tax=Saccharothrix deserti TaxID=2593674 RepID=UPI00131A6799|nr:response regulator [Saccharothrix deserti]
MAEMINAIATLLWPLVVLFLLFGFRSQLREVIKSAAKREVTLEIGGQTVSLGKLSEVQSEAIADLQKQLGELREQLGAPDETVVVTTEQQVTPFAVLWVDDHPENNVLEIAQLRASGVRVDLARSTQEGLTQFERGRYRAVVTDMGRYENGAEVPDAGLQLVDAVRVLDPAVPVAVYSAGRTARTMTDDATSAGANLVTDSPWELSEFFRKLELR